MLLVLFFIFEKFVEMLVFVFNMLNQLFIWWFYLCRAMVTVPLTGSGKKRKLKSDNNFHQMGLVKQFSPCVRVGM